MRMGRTAAMRALWQVSRGARQPGVPGLGERLRALPRMVGLGLTGRYPGVTRGRLGMFVLAAVYLVSPVDLVPELFVPVLGLGDDALLLTWLAGAVLADTGDFLAWEADAGRRGQVVTGQVLGSPAEPT
jgi:uncharacterized membrane protein YkvA (DUF1232 family)